MPTSRARVLLVEDDAVLRSSMVGALEQADFTVQGRADGRDFDDQLASFLPDLVLLDVMLPGESGLELARRARIRSPAAIVFLTARNSGTDRLGDDVGADDYVAKPFVIAELIARLRAVLHRCGRVASSTLEIGDLLVDEERGIALRSGAAVKLTATELRLLAYLARNHARVLSKTQILTQVWGYDKYDPNLVETFVSSLRRKLEAHGPRLIHTVRGLGYRLSVQ